MNTVVITQGIEKGYIVKNAVGIYITVGIGTVDIRHWKNLSMTHFTISYTKIYNIAI